jgi:membrane dipeptidase
MDHIAKIAGHDHVGLGSDFDGVSSLPNDLDGIDKLPNITRALLARGWSEEDEKKALGGNFLRVMRAAEACAAATKTSHTGDGSTKSIK